MFEITLFQEWKTLAAQLLQRTLFLYFYRTILVFRKVQISYLCPFTSPLFFSGKWCKGKYYFLNHQIFSKIFFQKLSEPFVVRSSVISNLVAGRKGKNYFRNFQIFSRFFLFKTSQNLFASSFKTPHCCGFSLEAGAKISTFSFPFQIFLQLFSSLRNTPQTISLTLNKLVMKNF